MILSPDAVVGLVFSESIVVVEGVNDEVAVGVMGWIKVGDHTAGDAQEAHH